MCNEKVGGRMSDKTSDKNKQAIKTSDRLLSCPFCGGEAEICDGCIEEFLKTEHMKYVQCNYCKASTKLYFTEKEAIKAWNTRKPMERIMERLKEEPYINKGGELFLNGYNEDCLPLRKVFEIVKEEGGIE